MIKKRYNSRLWSVYMGVFMSYIAHGINNTMPIYLIALMILTCIAILFAQITEAVLDYKSKELNDKFEDAKSEELDSAHDFIKVIKRPCDFNATIDKHSQKN